MHNSSRFVGEPNTQKKKNIYHKFSHVLFVFSHLEYLKEKNFDFIHSGLLFVLLVILLQI